jgi:hypothetical protein
MATPGRQALRITKTFEACVQDTVSEWPAGGQTPLSVAAITEHFLRMAGGEVAD